MNSARLPSHREGGFSLMESIVATIIAVIAIAGLAHTFGLGRGFIERFEIARTALGLARGQMESLVAYGPSSDSLAIGASFQRPFSYQGRAMGQVEWRIDPFDDPSTSVSTDLRNVTLKVWWGTGLLRDSVQIHRLFPLE